MKKYIIILLLLPLLGCGKRVLNQNINMPSTPLLTFQSKWGVVKNSYIKITHLQDRHNNIIATFRRGDILEVLSMESEKGSGDSVYWYEVVSEQIHGMVLEAELDLYDSKAKAINASIQLVNS